MQHLYSKKIAALKRRLLQIILRKYVGRSLDSFADLSQFISDAGLDILQEYFMSNASTKNEERDIFMQQISERKNLELIYTKQSYPNVDPKVLAQRLEQLLWTMPELSIRVRSLDRNQIPLFVHHSSTNNDKQGTILYLTSNDLPEPSLLINNLKEDNPNLYTFVHDHDNHHLVSRSLALSSSCNAYIPAHPHYNHFYYLASSGQSTQVVPPPVTQFSLQYLKSISLSTDARINSPLGIHAFYKQFTLRNSLIEQLSQTYVDVRFLDQWPYTGSTDPSRLTEWERYKATIVLPTASDIPIRIFDSLVTGSIPILPTSLRWYSRSLKCVADTALYYDSSALITISSQVEMAIALFDSETLEHRQERVDESISTYLADYVIASNIATNLLPLS